MSSENVNFPPVPVYPPDNMGDYLTPAQLSALTGVALSSMAARIPEWLATEDPPIVNTTLRTVLAGIVWHAERGTVTLRWDDK